jgi:hypothetical protein
MTIATRGTQRGGRVRAARFTDLAAVGELSRLSHTAERDSRNGTGKGNGAARVRTLGLPVHGGQISIFSLFRLPLGAFQPHDRLYVYEDQGRISGLARVEHDSLRDESTVIELDAIDVGDAGDIRYRLVQHLLRDGSKGGTMRFHVACADAGGNVELFMQAGFARYGEEVVLFRAADLPLPAPVALRNDAPPYIRPTVPLDALRLDRLYRAATPAPVCRLEAYRLHDWERQGSHWRVPRSSLTPILRFADVEVFVELAGPLADAEALGFVQVGVAKEDQPHYLRVISRPDHDPSALVGYGMGIIAERSGAGRGDRSGRHGAIERGIVTAMRTYESPLDRRLEEQGFGAVANVALLLKETTVRVAEPALVPAASR